MELNKRTSRRKAKVMPRPKTNPEPAPDLMTVREQEQEETEETEEKPQTLSVEDSETEYLAQRTKRTQRGTQLERQKEQAEEYLSDVPEEDQGAEMLRRELAARALAYRKLIPFILRFDQSYLPGWAHHDIAARLEKFSDDVAAKRGPRLILELPPRHGKSTLASHYFPAWHLGRYPNHEVITTSHTATLAEKFSRKNRELLRSRLYKSVFPTAELDKNSQSVQQWNTTRGGGLLAAGVGGGILGSGAHCLPLWAEVMTPSGPRTVDWLVKNVAAAPKVLSYDGVNVVERKINGCVSRESDHYYEIEATGGAFYATGEHPVCVGAEGGKLVYRRVDELRTGDTVLSVSELGSWNQALRGMPGVRGSVYAQATEVLAERGGVRAAGTHVFERLSVAVAKLAAVGQSGLRRVWEGVFGTSERCVEAAQEHLLQQCLPGQAPQQDLRGRGAPSAQQGGGDLRTVWDGVSAEGVGSGADGTGGGTAVLQQGLLRRGVAWSAYPSEADYPWGKILPARVQAGESENAQGRDAVRGVRGVGEGSTSPGRGQGEQHAGELAAGVPELPRGASPSVVTRVTRVECGLTVADFEVDATHCFVTPSGKVLLNCLIIDDPVKNAEEAQSDGTKEAIWEWFATTAYTRLAPGGGVLIIMQRWDGGDLAGILQQKAEAGEGDDYEVVRYPAIAEEDERFRKKGEALHPDRYPLTRLEAIKNTMDDWMWSALFQQRPIKEEGNYFTKDMLVLYDEKDLPADEELTFYATWDFAISQKQRADWTVGISAGVDRHGNIWLVDRVRDRMDAFEIADAILQMWEDRPHDMMAGEQGQIKLAIGPYLEREATDRGLYDFELEELSTGRKDKVQRARSIQGMMRRGAVRVPKDAPWRSEFIAELLAFPNGEFDDQVDALAHLGLLLQELQYNDRRPRSPRKDESGWRKKLRELMGEQSGGRDWRGA